MTANTLSLRSPKGRIVQGDLYKPNTKNKEGLALTFKDGTPRKDFFIALAVSKADPEVNTFIQNIQQAAATAWPQLFPNGQSVNPNFAMKIEDGDSVAPDSTGKKNADREGYAGCWVFKMSTSFPPKCFVKHGEDNYEDVTAAQSIARGDYVCVVATVRSNGSNSNPGMFLNPDQVLFMEKGEPIAGAVDPSQAFAGVAAATPPGATAPGFAQSQAAAPMPGQPMSPMAQAAIQAGLGTQPNAAPAQPMSPTAQVAAPAQAPAAPQAATPQPQVTPHESILTPAEPMYRTPDGGVHAESALVAAGWQPAAIAALPRT